MQLKDIKPNPINPRTMTEAAGDELEASLDEYGDLSGFVFNHDGTIISGHQRWEKIKDRVKAFEVKEQFKTPLADGTVQRGYFELTDGRKYDYSVRKWPKRKADAATIRANKKNAGEWDKDVLPKWGYTQEEMIEYGVDEWVFEANAENETDGEGGGTSPPSSVEARKSLSERFIIPPFSVFDTRQGYWQTRKRQWLALGIKSELGRGGGMTYNDHEWQREKLGKVQAFTGGGANIRRDTAERAADNETAGKIRNGGGGVKMAMQNDPKQRKAKYDGKKG